MGSPVPSTTATMVPSPVLPLSPVWTPAVFLPMARSIGGIVAMITIEEQGTDELQITDHPLEQGSPISDHAFKRPVTVNITAGWTAAGRGIGVYNDLSAQTGVYGLLLSWQAALIPFNVITGKRAYSNMLIERLIVTTDEKTEYSLIAQIGCRQVIIVGTQTVQVTGTSNDPSQQSNPENNATNQSNGDQSTNQPNDLSAPQNTANTNDPTNGAAAKGVDLLTPDTSTVGDTLVGGGGGVTEGPGTGAGGDLGPSGGGTPPSSDYIEPPPAGSQPPAGDIQQPFRTGQWQQSPRSRRNRGGRSARGLPGTALPTHFSSSGTSRAIAGRSTSMTLPGRRRY